MASLALKKKMMEGRGGEGNEGEGKGRARGESVRESLGGAVTPNRKSRGTCGCHVDTRKPHNLVRLAEPPTVSTVG